MPRPVNSATPCAADRPGVGRGYLTTLRERVVAYAERAAAAGPLGAEVADALGLAPIPLAR